MEGFAMIIHRNVDLFSACSSAGILFTNLDRSTAAAVLSAAGFDESLLDVPSDPILYRSTWTQAVNSELNALAEAIDDLPQYGDDVVAIHDKQVQIEAGMIKLNRQLRIEGIRTEIARAEAEMDRQLPIMRKIMGAKAEDWEVRMMVNHGPLGKRLQALLSEMQELMI